VRATLSLAKKAGAVIGAVSTSLGLAKWAFGDEHQPANFWLLLGLALLTAVFAWAWLADRFKAREELPPAPPHIGGNLSMFTAPVTNNFFGGSPDYAAQQTQNFIGPRERPSGSLDIVRLAEHVEYPSYGPARLKDKHFCNVVLQGPVVLGFVGPGNQMIDTQFGLANDDPGSAFWIMEPGEVKLGVVGTENCTFEGCVFHDVAFAGGDADFETFRRGIGR
jgi:hypothetical protein